MHVVFLLYVLVIRRKDHGVTYIVSTDGQGCVLSPTMFSVYIKDLAEQINNIHYGITIDDIMVSILLYADDIALVAPDSDRLQGMLNVVTEWCDRWKLSKSGEDENRAL